MEYRNIWAKLEQYFWLLSRYLLTDFWALQPNVFWLNEQLLRMIASLFSRIQPWTFYSYFNSNLILHFFYSCAAQDLFSTIPVCCRVWKIWLSLVFLHEEIQSLSYFLAW